MKNPNNKTSVQKPLSASVDMPTGEHLFQLIFSNSQQMFNQTLFTQTSGDWTTGNNLIIILHFGLVYRNNLPFFSVKIYFIVK